MKTIWVYSVAVLICYIEAIVSGAAIPDDSKLTTSSSTITTLPLLIQHESKNTSMKSQNNTDVYGKTDAEQLDELSVIDVIFKKRSHDDVQAGDQPTKSEKDPVNVEEVEVVSYEEISSEEDDDKGEVKSKVVIDTYIASEAPQNDATTTTDDYSVKEEVFVDVSLFGDGDLKPPSKRATSASFENDSNPSKTENKLHRRLADIAAGLR